MDHRIPSVNSADNSRDGWTRLIRPSKHASVQNRPSVSNRYGADQREGEDWSSAGGQDATRHWPRHIRAEDAEASSSS
jgi:hypothetical protein